LQIRERLLECQKPQKHAEFLVAGSVEEKIRTMLSEQQEFPTPPPRSSKGWIAGAVLLAAAGLLTVAVLNRRSDEPPDNPRMGPIHPAVGQRLERLALQPLTGDPPPLATGDLQGRVTLINFWGPWCGPCRIEFPHLVEIEQHFRSQADFQFVSVSCSNQEGSDEHMARGTALFLKEQRASFPTYRDADGRTRRAVMEAAGQFAYPTTLVIGREGTIRAMWVGYAPGVERQIRQVVEQALADKLAAGPTMLVPSKAE
jgi:thiol-disulfide isomerase/thioredoxin